MTGDSTLSPLGPGAMVSTDLNAVTRVRGLTVDQRRFLGARLLYATDAECARSLNPPLAEQTPRAWRETSPLFAAAYETLWDDGIVYAKGEARRLLGRGVATIEALLNAESPVRTKQGVATITVTDEDGNEREQVVTAPDWLARAKGAEMLLRANGMWQPAPDATAASEGAAMFGEMARILQLRREEMEAAARTRRSDVASIEGTTVEP